jgi:hypothetical protein
MTELIAKGGHDKVQIRLTGATAAIPPELFNAASYSLPRKGRNLLCCDLFVLFRQDWFSRAEARHHPLASKQGCFLAGDYSFAG